MVNGKSEEITEVRHVWRVGTILMGLLQLAQIADVSMNTVESGFVSFLIW
jgi:hypothetical protein